MANRLTKLVPARLRPDHTVIPVVRLSGMISSGGTALRPSLSLASAAPLFEQLNLPDPNEEQLGQTRSLLDQASLEGTRRSGGRNVPLTEPVIKAAFMLGSAQFQKR